MALAEPGRETVTADVLSGRPQGSGDSSWFWSGQGAPPSMGIGAKTSRANSL
jgi:hypothetical protein